VPNAARNNAQTVSTNLTDLPVGNAAQQFVENLSLPPIWDEQIKYTGLLGWG